MTRGRNLLLGEIGCALSHLSIYKRVIENDLSGALIFEDDVIINTYTLLEKINNATIILNKKNEAYILHLDTNNLFKEKMKLEENIFEFKKGSGTHAYYINRKACYNMLRAFGNYPQIPIDFFKILGKAGVFKLYGFEQALCIPNSFDSTIDNKIKRVIRRQLALPVGDN